MSTEELNIEKLVELFDDYKEKCKELGVIEHLQQAIPNEFGSFHYVHRKFEQAKISKQHQCENILYDIAQYFPESANLIDKVAYENT